MDVGHVVRRLHGVRDPRGHERRIELICMSAQTAEWHVIVIAKTLSKTLLTIAPATTKALGWTNLVSR